MRTAVALGVTGLALLAPASPAQAPDSTPAPAATPSPTATPVPGRPSAQIDIEIAVDTTGSMGPSIAQARRDAREIVTDTQRLLPGARFAVVDFKDTGDTPEYLVRQPMTDRAKLVEAAIDELEASGGGDAPEAYNLVFTRATDESALGLRPGSRRLLFVIGDAEPHGAANAELPGCADTTPDPNGLRTNAVLSVLRRARVTANFILQASSASTTLRCYESLAGLSYGDGEALLSGRGGRRKDQPATGLGELIERAIADGLPSVAARPVATRAGAASRARIALVNRVPEAVELARLTVELPEGFTYRPGSTRGFIDADPEVDGQTLRWGSGRSLPAFRRRGVVLGFRAPAEAQDAEARVTAAYVMPDGGILRARTTLELEVRGDDE